MTFGPVRAFLVVLGAVVLGGGLACSSRALSGNDGGPGGGVDGQRDLGGAEPLPQSADGGVPSADAGPTAPGRVVVASPVAVRDFDILFMVDNSRSMLPLQQKLITNFPVFMQTLQMLPMGLPNLHIAVVTSDMGAGANSVQLCNNDQGIFRSSVGPAAAANCTVTGLDVGEHFISSVNGQNNFTGNIVDVFSCIAAVGQDGCGFESQLKSVARALGADGAPPPVENANFLRVNAMLVIVLVTNEDDCSVPSESDLFVSGTRHQYVADPEGPLTSYRCNEFGHLCNGAPPPRTTTATFAPGACVPAEEAGRLIPVHTLIDQIKSVKADPSQILISVIGGPPDPYSVLQVPPLIAQDPAPTWPQIDHSCGVQSTGEYADPGVRLAAFATAFGSDSQYLTACADSYAPALQGIAERVGRPTSQLPLCLPKIGADAQGRPDCTVVQEVVDAAAGVVADTGIPRCSDVAPGATCWSVGADAASCAAGLPLSVTWSSQQPPPSGALIKASCAPCTPGAVCL